MRTSKETINQTAKQFGDELRAALTYTSPDLSHEGLEKQRQMLADRVRAKYRGEVAEHREALYYDRDRNAFDKHRPRLDWGNPAAVAKAQSKWNTVAAKLDAGLSIGEVIDAADETTLTAVSEFYADYAEVQRATSLANGQTYEQPDVSAVTRAVEDRAADLKGTGSALKTARQAAGLQAYADVTLDHIDAQIEGRPTVADDLSVALEARYAEAQATAGGQALIQAVVPADASADVEATAAS